MLTTEQAKWVSAFFVGMKVFPSDVAENNPAPDDAGEEADITRVVAEEHAESGPGGSGKPVTSGKPRPKARVVKVKMTVPDGWQGKDIPIKEIMLRYIETVELDPNPQARFERERWSGYTGRTRHFSKTQTEFEFQFRDLGGADEDRSVQLDPWKGFTPIPDEEREPLSPELANDVTPQWEGEQAARAADMRRQATDLKGLLREVEKTIARAEGVKLPSDGQRALVELEETKQDAEKALMADACDYADFDIKGEIDQAGTVPGYKRVVLKELSEAYVEVRSGTNSSRIRLKPELFNLARGDVEREYVALNSEAKAYLGTLLGLAAGPLMTPFSPFLPTVKFSDLAKVSRVRMFIDARTQRLTVAFQQTQFIGFLMDSTMQDNVKFWYGMKSAYIKNLYELIDAFKAQGLGPDDVVFTGSSRGGALAKIAASRMGGKSGHAETFNSAPESVIADPERAHSKDFRVEGEALGLVAKSQSEILLHGSEKENENILARLARLHGEVLVGMRNLLQEKHDTMLAILARL